MTLYHPGIVSANQRRNISECSKKIINHKILEKFDALPRIQLKQETVISGTKIMVKLQGRITQCHVVDDAVLEGPFNSYFLLAQRQDSASCYISYL